MLDRKLELEIKNLELVVKLRQIELKTRRAEAKDFQALSNMRQTFDVLRANQRIIMEKLDGLQ